MSPEPKDKAELKREPDQENPTQPGDVGDGEEMIGVDEKSHFAVTPDKHPDDVDADLADENQPRP